METTDEPTLEEMETEGKNTDAADAELQFESPPPASEGEELEVEAEEADADTMPVTQPVSHPEESVVDPESMEPESLKPEPVEPIEPMEPKEPMEPMEPESTEATDPEPASPQEKDLPELKTPELPREAQGPAPKLRNFFRRHAEEGRGHPVSTSKIGKIVAPAVEISGDADEAQTGEVMEHPAEHPAEHSAEPAVDVPQQPEEQPEEPDQAEHLEEELEQPPEPELANEQSQDQSAKLDTSLEDTGTPTEDKKVEGQETSRPFTEAEEAPVPEVPAESGRSLRSSEPERRSKSAGPFLAEMPERELARRVWRASAVPRAGGKPRVQELSHVPQVPQGRGAPQRRDENRRILRGKNGPRSVSPRDQVARRTPSAGRGKQAEKEKEPRVWKARKFQPESSTTKMPFTRPPPPPPPIEMLPEMTWKPQKAPERVRVH